MIILVTGTPGAGKSLYGVSQLLNKQFKDRPKFVNGVPNLLIDHTPLTDEDVEHWFQGGMPVEETHLVDGQQVVVTKPAFELKNAVIFVDEVQRIARPRSPSVKAPEWITKLEVHRHSGCDFIFVTQHPNQMDAHIRRLVGRHIHVRRTWGLGAAVVYEWDSCNDVKQVATAQSKVWRYNKHDFALYKSSELHTKAGGNIPAIVWLLGLCAIALPILGYQVVKRFGMRFGDEANNVTATAAGGKAVKASSGVGKEAKPMTAAEYVAMYRPRIEGMAHTAPAYDGLTSPRTVPLPAACIQSSSAHWKQQYPDGCACYTQQGSPYPTTPGLCRQFVQHKPFLPWQPDPSTTPPQGTPIASASAKLAGPQQ